MASDGLSIVAEKFARLLTGGRALIGQNHVMFNSNASSDFCNILNFDHDHLINTGQEECCLQIPLSSVYDGECPLRGGAGDDDDTITTTDTNTRTECAVRHDFFITDILVSFYKNLDDILCQVFFDDFLLPGQACKKFSAKYKSRRRLPPNLLIALIRSDMSLLPKNESLSDEFDFCPEIHFLFYLILSSNSKIYNRDSDVKFHNRSLLRWIYSVNALPCQNITCSDSPLLWKCIPKLALQWLASLMQIPSFVSMNGKRLFTDIKLESNIIFRKKNIWKLAKEHIQRYLEFFLSDYMLEIDETFQYVQASKSGMSLRRKDFPVGIKLDSTCDLCVTSLEPWKIGDIIPDFSGTLIPLTEEQLDQCKQHEKDFSILYNINQSSFSLLLGPVRFMNHDCRPNVKFTRRGPYHIQVQVIEPISVGDEILTSYGDHYFGMDNVECLCSTCKRRRTCLASQDRPDGHSNENADVNFGTNTKNAPLTRKRALKAIESTLDQTSRVTDVPSQRCDLLCNICKKRASAYGHYLLCHRCERHFAIYGVCWPFKPELK